jgi:hypothetical protein
MPGFFGKTHVIFGGTGAVGGATVMQMVALLQEAASRSRVEAPASTRIVVTGRSKEEIRQFTSVLFKVQERDTGRTPVRHEGTGYDLFHGVIVQLAPFVVDPSLPSLNGISGLESDERDAAMNQFLSHGGLGLGCPSAVGTAYLQQVLAADIAHPFSQFLMQHVPRREAVISGKPYRSVVVSIPIASAASYRMNDLEAAAKLLGVERGSERMMQLKETYLRSLRDDLAHVAEHLAEEVLVAHTTAVGGMYDEEEGDRKPIRLGFAHSAIDTRLLDKQLYAEILTRLYAEKGIKTLITAAAIGVDQILIHESPPLKADILRRLREATGQGQPLFGEHEVAARLRTYPPAQLDLLAEPHEPLTFLHGRQLTLDLVIKSGENGYFTAANTDALYRVMRVTSSGELGLLLARTALLGDDPQSPSFPDNTCYYTETDNSRQVFDLLDQPRLRQNQISGLQPKALQDLGSAKHQAELHLLGLLILLHRLKTLDLDALPAHVDLTAFQPQEYFEAHSQPLTLEEAASAPLAALAADLRRLATARDEADLRPLKSFVQADPSRQEAAHRVLQEVLHAAWAIPSIGTPILWEEAGRRRVAAGYYAAPIDHILTHRDSFAAFFRRRSADLGRDGDQLESLIEFHIANNGFADIRPLAVLVTARSEKEDLNGKVRVFAQEEELLCALADLEPYSYFTTSGLIAFLVRLKGIVRASRQFDLSIGTANEFRAHMSFDHHGRALLVPGIIETFIMVSEGLEKNTGSERLDGKWGYDLDKP